MAKRYYWLKLKEDFFDKKLIKKLRSIAGGDTYTIIYLKMQLKSIKDEGILKYEGIENSFEEELALDIDEDIENVKVVLNFLQKHNMIMQLSDENFLLSETLECIGSESDSAERVRKYRENKKSKEQKLLQSNALVTARNTEKEIEKEIDIDRFDLINIKDINSFYLEVKEKMKNEYKTIVQDKAIDIVLKRMIGKKISDPFEYVIQSLCNEVNQYEK